MHQPRYSTAEAPLRVLHVIPTLTGGGAETFLCALARSFDPWAVHAGVMPVYPTRVPFALSERRSIDVIDVNRRGRYDPGFFGRMMRGMRAFRPDIVHAHLHNGKYWGRLAALAARVPIVVFTEHSPQGEPRLLPEVLVDEVLNRVTDGVITFTERQRSMLEVQEHIPRSKLRVISNGIDLPAAPDANRRSHARKHVRLDDEHFAVFVLGRLEPVKNVELAVRAIAALPASARKDVRLCVVGSGSQENALHELAASLNVSGNVTFLGHRDDAVELLYGADALLIPSLVEGMPLAALEAMSVGVPVMATPWPGTDELLRQRSFGIVLADWSPSAAAAALASASAKRSALRDMADRALPFARSQYDIRRTAHEHQEYYLELARRKGLR